MKRKKFTLAERAAHTQPEIRYNTHFQEKKSLCEVLTSRFLLSSSNNFSQCNFQIKAAFTLAEVLITLGIIGIVAAMTLPTLMNNVQDKVLESQRQKAASVLANGYKKMLADNEVFSMRETPLYSCFGSSDDLLCVETEHKKIFKTIYSGIEGMTVNLDLPEQYLDGNGNPLQNNIWNPDLYVFVTPDGYVYGLDVPTFINTGSIYVISDVNGIKNPNTVNKDLLVYNISQSGTAGDITCNIFDCGPTAPPSTTCSFSNPGACTTRDECFAIDTPVGVCMRFENGVCSVIYNCSV